MDAKFSCSLHCITTTLHYLQSLWVPSLVALCIPSKQSTSADVSLTSVQRQFNVEVTLD